MGVSGHREIAEWILAHCEDPFADLAYNERLHLVSGFVRNEVIGGKRRTELRGHWSYEDNGNGSREGVFRLAASGKPIWHVEWTVGNKIKETGDLTRSDVALLRADMRKRSTELAAKDQWLGELDALMRRHRVDVAGKLRQKGVELPDIEIHEADE